MGTSRTERYAQLEGPGSLSLSLALSLSLSLTLSRDQFRPRGSNNPIWIRPLGAVWQAMGAGPGVG